MKKILLIEDEEEIIEMYKDRFDQERDLNLISALSVKKGLQLRRVFN